MGKKDAQERADEFMKNADKNDNAANDKLVKDQDPRDPHIVEERKK